MNISKLVLMGVVVVGLCLICAGQRGHAAPGAPENNPPFLQTQWTTENGLPQNSVSALAQTPDGYLWLGTFGGLARFDGVKFTAFNTGNTPALPSSRITALHVGRDGSLWIGAETGDVTRLANGHFSFFARISPDANGDKLIRYIYEDRAGAVWVSADRHGLTRFVAGDAKRAEHFDERQGVPPGTVHGLCEDRDGKLWAVTAYGLALWHDGPAGAARFTTQLHGTANNYMLKIRPHPDGGLWLLTQDNLNRFHDGRLTPYLHLPHFSNVFAPLAETATGALLFSYATDRIFRIERNGTHTFIALKAAQPNLSNVHSLFEDREGHIWVGSTGAGLFRLQRRRATMLNAATGLPDTGGNSVLEDRHGAVWIGTSDGLCRIVGGQVTTFYTSPAAHKQQDSHKVGALYEDRAGALWFGIGNAIVRYQDERFTKYPLPEMNLVTAIIVDRQGQMWLGSPRGLLRFTDGRTQLYTQHDGLVNNDVKFIYEDRAGALWLGTPGGVSRFYNNVFTNYTTAEGLSNNYVRAVYEDADGALWLGTYGGGLNRLQNGRFTHITTKHGLYDDFISYLYLDENDDFWALSNRGVLRVNRAALNQVAAGESKAVYCVVYNEADGMTPSEGNGGHQPAGWRARDGRFYFSTIRGVAVVEPQVGRPLAPPVVIERVVLDGAELDFHQPIAIQPGQGNLEIHYTALSLGQPEEVRFRVQLSGSHNDEWLDVTRRTAYFSQLQPGQYLFRVKALSPEGVWSEQAAELSFVVRPLFWQTSWFRALLLCGLLGAVWTVYRGRVAIYRARAERQEAFARQLINSQEQERQRIAAELHDGLGQSLVIIKRRALLCRGAAHDPEQVMEQVEEIIEASTHAISEVREVIFDLRPQQLDRLGLTGAVSDLLDRAARVNGWHLTKQLDKVDGLFPKEAENSLYRVVQESVNNISKHAAATHVAVSLVRHHNWVELAVQDDGQGFAAEAANGTAGNGFGLHGITERARFLGGQAIIESAHAQGTTIRLRLPCVNP